MAPDVSISKAETGGSVGRLILCGTPIGNLGDAPPRLREALESATIVAAEDTRRTRRLMSSLGVESKARVVSCFDATEKARAEELVEAALAGAVVALVTDAGMPAVSDPGFRVVAAFALAGLEVTVVPGPSSVTAAVAVSGLASDRWCVEGFLSRSGGERRRRIAELVAEQRTMVFLESPHRIASMVDDLASAFGADRPAVACRELTKLHEEVVRGTLGELAEWCRSKTIKGELTLVVAGAPPPGPVEHTPEELAQLVSATGLSAKEGIASVAKTTGVSKREVYAAVVAGKAAKIDGGDH